MIGGVPITAKVLTVKVPASHALLGFVPPVLKMNERAAPFLTKLPPSNPSVSVKVLVAVSTVQTPF